MALSDQSPSWIKSLLYISGALHTSRLLVESLLAPREENDGSAIIADLEDLSKFSPAILPLGHAFFKGPPEHSYLRRLLNQIDATFLEFGALSVSIGVRILCYGFPRSVDFLAAASGFEVRAIVPLELPVDSRRHFSQYLSKSQSVGQVEAVGSDLREMSEHIDWADSILLESWGITSHLGAAFQSHLPPACFALLLQSRGLVPIYLLASKLQMEDDLPLDGWAAPRSYFSDVITETGLFGLG